MTRLESWLQENEAWRPYVDLVVYPPHPDEIAKEFPDASRDVLSRAGELVRECDAPVSRGALYVRIRRQNKKCDDKWAAMLCLQAPPRINTSDTFWSGRKPWHEVYGDSGSTKNNTYINDIRRTLARRGVNLKPGDEYMPELARFKGDPEAIVPFSGARSYIKNLCEKRGWECNGSVETKHREPESDPLSDENCVPLAKDIIRQKARQMVASDPGLKRKSRAELKRLVLEKHGPSKTKPAKVHIPD